MMIFKLSHGERLMLLTIILTALLVSCAGSPTAPAPRASASVLPALGPGDFTLVYLPDTQYYSESYPATWTAQVQWIAANRGPLNIQFVSHLGDVVDNATATVEWQRASAAMAVLDSITPLGIAPGNHDLRGNWVATGGTWDKYRQWFPQIRYSAEPWWGGYYKANNLSRASSYQKITVGTVKLLFLHLEFQAPDDVLNWARTVVANNPNYRVHVSTHSYLDPTGTRVPQGGNLRPTGNQGEAIWQELVRGAPNIRLVHSAHLCGEARRVSTNDAGLAVDEILTDYQCGPNGGDGWLRYYVVRPALGIAEAYTYSPTRDEYDTDAESQFVLGWMP